MEIASSLPVDSKNNPKVPESTRAACQDPGDATSIQVRTLSINLNAWNSTHMNGVQIGFILEEVIFCLSCTKVVLFLNKFFPVL